MNATFNVGTIFHCEKLFDYTVMDRHNVIWSQTVTGCNIVQFLQDLYKFNISYVIQHINSNVTVTYARDGAVYPFQDDNIDIYTRPMSLRPELLDHSYPIQSLNVWRFGFLIRRPEAAYFFQTFYSKPFNGHLWFGLHVMTVIITLLFYFLKKWETHVFGNIPEQGVTYEMLMVFGAYCQHIPPLHTMLISRRTAYFVFFVYAYVIYSFYTSNLLSHLVNDKDVDMTLDKLIYSHYECAIVDDLKVYRDHKVVLNYDHHMNTIEYKLLNMKTMTVSEGLENVIFGKTALLADYVALYPRLKQHFDSDTLCKLATVDLFKDIKKYFFTSKNFKYKEQFKIGTLRAMETGVLKRLIFLDTESPINCEATRLVQAQIFQISSLLCVLLCFYTLAIFILIGERIHFKRNIVWPYVD